MLGAFALQTALAAEWPSRPLQPLAQQATRAAQDVAGRLKGVREVSTIASHRVDVMQVFGAEGGIARAAVARNVTAAQVVDGKCGWNLKKKKKDLEATCDLFYSGRPKFASIGLPRTNYANIAYLSYRAPRGQ